MNDDVYAPAVRCTNRCTTLMLSLSSPQGAGRDPSMRLVEATLATPSDRVRILLIVVGAVAAIVVALFILLVIATGVKMALVRLRKLTFTRMPEHPSDSARLGPLGFLWILFVLASACLAFIFSVGWLWGVSIGSGVFLGIVALWGQEEITN